MIMADVFTALFLTLGALLTIVSYWLLFAALTPVIVSRAEALYRERLKKTVLVGVASAVPLVLLGLSLANAPAAALKLVGVALLLGLILLGQLGSAGLARHIGARLGELESAGQYSVVLRGGTILALTFLLPGVGWFVLLPFTLISGLGAALLSLKGPRAEAITTLESDAQP